MYTCQWESFSDETYTRQMQAEEGKSTAGDDFTQDMLCRLCLWSPPSREWRKTSQAEGHVCKGTEVHVILPGESDMMLAWAGSSRPTCGGLGFMLTQPGSLERGVGGVDSAFPSEGM